MLSYLRINSDVFVVAVPLKIAVADSCGEYDHVSFFHGYVLPFVVFIIIAGSKQQGRSTLENSIAFMSVWMTMWFGNGPPGSLIYFVNNQFLNNLANYLPLLPNDGVLKTLLQCPHRTAQAGSFDKPTPAIYCLAHTLLKADNTPLVLTFPVS